MPDWMEQVFVRSPQAITGRRNGAVVTHGELIESARAWAALGRRNPGHDVALFIEDSVEFAAALLGAWQAHKTVWLAADTVPATCAALDGKVDAFWGTFPSGQSPASTDHCALPWHTPAPLFPALVVHTSGSTGAPKAARKSMAQLTCELAALEAVFGARIGGAEVLATVTHQHIYGLLFRVLWPLAAGRVFHATPYPQPEALVPALAAAGQGSVLVASPAHLKRLPSHLDWSGAGTQLRAVFSSGGMLDDAGAAHARGLLQAALLELYGSSETGGVAWRERAVPAGCAPAWLPLPQVRWRVRDGLLEVRSPHADAEHWLATADRAAAQDAGFMLLGRSDRIVKIEEKRVSLEALEAALITDALVAEARVVPCPALPGSRQMLAAFIVPTAAGRSLLASGGKAAMDRRLRARLADCAEAMVLPRRSRYLAQLPLGAQGKISDTLLLELLQLPARPTLPAVRLIEEGGEQVLLELRVPSALLYFDGHFTSAPVLPGVVQVDWAILFARRYFAITGDFCGMHALKFQQMIRPDRPVRLALRFEATSQCLHFRYLSDAGPHASGRILFDAPRRELPC